MKINYKNTCLEWLEHPEKMAFSIPENNKGMTEKENLNFGHSLRNGFIEIVKAGMFKDKIRFISEPFLKAFDKGKSKLINVFDKEDMSETGTFITQLGSWTNTYFYFIKTLMIDGKWDMEFTLMVFTKHAQTELPNLDACVFDVKSGRKSIIWKDWDDKGMKADYWSAWLISLLCFIKYCPLETKLIDGKRKAVHVGNKYVNETEQSIEILDSTWFTTIICSEGFNVGGHFRMQPYGPGLASKRLQWIEPFQKHGYVRKAKIL